jgi:tetratricopeptide (TPR) repeat protein
MSSIIEGYNYDIFISYRQKDNKHDGWVSEFVNNLKGELESTFKEEISVYFDINPHDGLLETHDVDASLKDKLKCLVFIPIISRTYCDPKSFAWEHEFKAFVEQASQDKYGLKVKLPNGNVASRVLPVRIHDLDNEDVKCFEGITGSMMRTLDFVFKTSSGVNRPLKSKEDHPADNLNKTYYQDQINKVALAIKEIVQGMKAEPVSFVKEKILQKIPSEEVKMEERKDTQEKLTKSTYFKWLSSVLITAILVVAAMLAYLKIFKQDTLEKLRSSGERISIAVMPFQNMTNDTTWNVWQDVIQINLINSLSNTEQLKVRQLETINSLLRGKGLVNYASISPSLASSISQKLDANVFIYGSISKAGFTIRVNAQLINSKTEEVFKSFQIEGPRREEKIFHLIDSLSMLVKNFLIINKLGEEVSIDYQKFATTSSPEAYRYYINGENAFKKSDFYTARDWYLQTIAIDSNFTDAYIMLSSAYQFQGMYDQAKKWSLRLYKKRDILPMYQKVYANWGYARYFETPYEEIQYLEQLRELDDQIPFTYYLLGGDYRRLQQYDKAIPYFEKALDINKKWDVKPWWIYYYTHLGIAYHKTGQYKKEKKLYKKAQQDFPYDPDLLYRQAILILSEGKTKNANDYIEKYISISKSNSESEAYIATSLATIYSEAGILEKAEEYFRQALSLEPENQDMMNNLAYFLIDKERNINEGVELIETSLKLSSDNYNYLYTKGWGLYKQGKYKEALELLQKSWDLRRQNAIYDHEAFLHLEAAKKAVAGQKNN